MELNGKNVVTEVYGLSPMQSGMMFHTLYDKTSKAYIRQYVFDVTPGLDIERMERSWNMLLEGHSILRSAFYYDDLEVPVQCVFSSTRIFISKIEFISNSERSAKDAADDFIMNDRANGFDFKKPPLMRLACLVIDGVPAKLVWSYHHLVMDGWSLSRLFKEILTNYDSPVKVKIQEDRYSDFIRFLNSRNVVKEEMFWKKRLSSFTEPCLLAFIKDNDIRNKGIGAVKRSPLKLDENETENVICYARKNSVTLNTVLQCVWSYILFRYTGNTNVVFGITTSGRPPELDRAAERIGLYINTLPFATLVDEGVLIADWLRQIQLHNAEDGEFQFCGLNEIQRNLSIKGDWFDTLLVVENYPFDLSGDDLANKHGISEAENAVYGHSNYPLVVVVMLQNSLSINLEYNTTLIDSRQVELIQEDFRSVLLQLIGGQVTTVGELKLHCDLNSRGGKQVNYNRNGKTLLDLFENSVLRYPSRLAFTGVYGDHSYETMSAKVDELAERLTDGGIGAGDLVGILLGSSPEFVISMLACFKVGAAYVPLDTQLPSGRLKYLIEDSHASIVITKSASFDILPENTPSLIIDQRGNDLKKAAKHHLRSSGGDLAYVMYTSGSTGRPKGAMIEHDSILNVSLALADLYHVTPADRVLQFASMSFDMSLEEIFPPIIRGASIVFRDSSKVMTYRELVDFIEVNRVTVFSLTPQLLHGLIESEERIPSCLRMITLGGEKVIDSDLHFLSNAYPSLEVFNVYGPTETTVVVTTYTVPPSPPEHITIGSEIQNVRLYLFDKNGKISPVGVPGEICIAGAGTGRGYVNNPELTHDKFFRFTFNGVEERCYRSGDKAVMTFDGNFDYLGRFDHQVKLRGFRIELGEIENTIARSGLAKQCVVVMNSSGSNASLVAYVVPQPNFNRGDLYDFLNSFLPHYMLPSDVVEMDEFPTNENGKIDRTKLSLPESERKVVPVTWDSHQQLIREIWSELLSLDENDLDLQSDFFSLGGNSLMAIRCLSLLRKRFGVELTIRDIFSNTTIDDLSSLLRKKLDVDIAPPSVGLELRSDIVLSFSQERLWFVDKFSASLSYNLVDAFSIKGDIDLDALSGALRTIVNRHDTLRTIFYEVDGKPFGKLLPEDTWKLNVEPGIKSVTEIQAAILSEQTLPFDLGSDHMIRARVLRKEGDGHILIITTHHIATDGLSISLFVSELVELYSSNVQRRKPEVPVLAARYSDFAAWQRRQFSETYMSEALAYWSKKLSDVAILKLSNSSNENPLSPEQGASHIFTIKEELVSRLRQLSDSMGVTLFISLVGIYKSLLYRYTGQEDICIGAPYSERFRPEFDNLIGLFINPLILRDHVRGEMTFRELLNNVKTTTVDAFSNNIPFERIVQHVQQHRQTSNPIFQVQYALKDSVADVSTLEGLEIEPVSLVAPFIPFDMIFEATTTNEGLRTNVQYRSALFSADEIALMSQHFCKVLESVLDNPDITIGTIPLGWSPQHIRAQGHEHEFVSLVELFRSAANRFKTLPAVVTDKPMFYKDLDELSDRLSLYLVEMYNIRRNDIVAIVIERDEWAIVTILATIKAGAAFLPIDREHPIEHQSEIIADASPALIIVSPGNEYQYQVPTYVLDSSFLDIGMAPASTVDIRPDDAAYVIYTSGSTGKPKGVVVTHGGISNTIRRQIEIFNMSKDERALQFASLSFDASVSEVFISLLSGACLYIVPARVRKNPDQLVDFINSAQVSIATIPPVLLRQMNVGRFRSLTKLISAGEAAPAGKIREYLSVGCCFNAYGPTEVSICATVFKLNRKDLIHGENIPIGFPMENVDVYILDDQLRPVPEEIVGELYIGGLGVAAGYLNRPELTASKFIQDPFKPEGRVYKTGDMAKRKLDGTILFMGRNDAQVKIRGHRVEPGEIEHVLHELLPLHTSVVSTQADQQGEAQLVAYVKSDASLDLVELKKKLSARLSSYMVPAAILTMTDLPVTINGKLDRSSLPNPFKASVYVAIPGDDSESKFAKVVADVLGLGPQDVEWDKSFFNLGGHSIAAIQLVARLREIYHSQVTLLDVFETNSLHELWSRIEALREDNKTPEKNSESNVFSLTGFQRRIWLQSQFDEIDTFTIPMVYQLSGKLDLDAVQNAYKTLIDVHDALRTSIVQIDGQTMQKVFAPEEVDTRVNVVDLRGYESQQQQREIEKIVFFEFNLAVPPLVKLEIYRLTEDKFVLACLAHHIVTDHWSIGFFHSELIRLYGEWKKNGAIELQRSQFQFKDFVSWHKVKQSEIDPSTSGEFWSKVFFNSKKLDLPFDFPQPLYPNRSADLRETVIDANLLVAVKDFAKRHSVSVYMLLLGALYLLLRHLTDKEHVHVATPVINRDDSRFQNMMGCLLNMLLIEISAPADQTPAKFFQNVKSAVLNSSKYQYDFYEQLELYQSSGGQSLSPLYEIGFNYMVDRGSRDSFSNEGIIVSEFSEIKKTTNTPIWVSALHGDDTIKIEFRYSTQLFKRSSVEHWCIAFQRILSRLVSSGDRTIGEIIDFILMEETRDSQNKLTGIHQRKVASLKKHR